MFAMMLLLHSCLTLLLSLQFLHNCLTIIMVVSVLLNYQTWLLAPNTLLFHTVSSMNMVQMDPFKYSKLLVASTSVTFRPRTLIAKHFMPFADSSWVGDSLFSAEKIPPWVIESGCPARYESDNSLILSLRLHDVTCPMLSPILSDYNRINPLHIVVTYRMILSLTGESWSSIYDTSWVITIWNVITRLSLFTIDI